MTPECCLCAQFAGDAENDLIHQTLGAQEYTRRVIAEGSHVALIPSLGPLAEGHTLLCPLTHERSCASADPLAREALGDAADVVAEALTASYSRPVHRFEHGNARAGDRIACSVEHAHLHLVPLSCPVWPTAKEVGAWQEVDGGFVTLPKLVGEREYLYYESPEGSAHVWVTDGEPVPSQLLRRVIAEARGRPWRWNWRLDPDAKAADATFRRLRAVLGGSRLERTVSPFVTSS